MAVHGYSPAPGRFDFTYALVIATEDAGIVHHFAQCDKNARLQQLFDRTTVEGCAGRLERRGRNARRDGVVDLQRRTPGLFDHVPDSIGSADVRDFVRIGHNGDSAVSQRGVSV